MTMTISNVETALCLWEAVLEATMNDHVPRWLEVYRGDEGTFAARQLMMHLASDVDDLWDSLGEDPAAIVGAFDWEFCPAVLELMPDHYTLPTKAEILAHFKFISGE